MVFVKDEALCIFLKRLVYPCSLSGPHVKVWTKGSAPVMHDIKSSTKYYLRELGVFNEKYESKLVVQEKS